MILSIAMAAALAVQAAPIPARPAEERAAQPEFTSYTADFAVFVDETEAMPDEERAKLFRARFGALFPGFYRPAKGRSDAQYDATVTGNLKAFPAIREKYMAASRTFAQAFTAGQAHFRAAFPDYRLTMPVYLVHSLGQMDGGTREIGGHTVLIFGADVIARNHDQTTIGPFLDHELFHVYHSAWFDDCDAVWCGLWQEGLAVYVASRLNPGSGERQLLLNIPVSLPGAVDPRLKEAMCLTRAKLESTDGADMAAFFQGQPGNGPFPPRFGYYVGYLLAKKIGVTMSLSDIAHLPPAKVKPLLEKTLAGYGPCPPRGD